MWALLETESCQATQSQGGQRMMLHANAALSLKARRELCRGLFRGSGPDGVPKLPPSHAYALPRQCASFLLRAANWRLPRLDTRLRPPLILLSSADRLR